MKRKWIFRIANNWVKDVDYFHVDLLNIHFQTNFVYITILGFLFICEKERIEK